MSKPLQWVIGIGVVLVAAALVFSSLAPFFLPRAAIGAAPQFLAPNRLLGPRLPFLPGFLFRWGRPGPRLPFLGLFGLAGCIWPLLLAGLIVFAISLFGHRTAPPMAPPIPAAPVAVPAAPSSLVVCAQCGQPLQPGWRHCPNCGTAVSA